ncbi:MAG TPA: M17 family peptidase N-terminal domain-containing protein, partial [Rhizomicrobium sp.]|nr:M17 family peptidase N-terminal domain-containing protein [Rhizomicrobium sp.]
MQLSFTAPSLGAIGALVVGVQADAVFSPTAAEADKAAGGALKRAVSTSKFTGKPGQVLEILAPSGLKAARVLLVGLGKGEDFKAPAAERIGSAVIAKLFIAGVKDIAFAIDAPKGSKLKPGVLAAHIAMGATLRSYSFNIYRTKNLDEYKSTIERVTVGTKDVAAAKKTWATDDAVAGGVFLARDLVNEPPNVLYPAAFANRAKALSKLGLKVDVLGEAEMKKLGMGSLLGVGQGSERESQLVVMRWNGARKKDEAPVAFVGKGVCFDSGGLSLKPAGSMMGMKGDMGGAAAVTGV